MSTREEVTRKTKLEAQLRDSSNEIRNLREAWSRPASRR